MVLVVYYQESNVFVSINYLQQRLKARIPEMNHQSSIQVYLQVLRRNALLALYPPKRKLSHH